MTIVIKVYNFHFMLFEMYISASWVITMQVYLDSVGF